MDLQVLFLRESPDGLSECPDATVVVGDLGDDVVRVFREILDDYRLGFLAGVRGEIRPRRDLASKEKGDAGDGRVGQGGEIGGKAGWKKTRSKGSALCSDKRE